MNKKIWVSLGAAAVITTPILTVIACGDPGNKTIEDVETREEKISKKLSQVYTLIPNITEETKLAISGAIGSLVEGGVKNIQVAELSKVFQAFGAPDNLMGVKYLTLLQSDLFSIILKDGLNQFKGPGETKLDNLLQLILPDESMKNTQFLIKGLILGFGNIVEKGKDPDPNDPSKKIWHQKFEEVVLKIVESMFGGGNIGTKAGEDMKKTIIDAVAQYTPLLPILESGMLESTPKEWEITLEVLTRSHLLPLIAQVSPIFANLIKPLGDYGTTKIHPMLTSMPTLEVDNPIFIQKFKDIIQIFQLFLQKGFKSLSLEQAKTLAAYIDYAIAAKAGEIPVTIKEIGEGTRDFAKENLEADQKIIEYTAKEQAEKIKYDAALAKYNTDHPGLEAIVTQLETLTPQDLTQLGGTIIGFKTQATADSETVNAIDNAKIKTAIEATYSNQGTNLPSLTADQASVTVDGAIVSYTVANNDNNGQKTYTITSITFNGIDVTQDLTQLGGTIIGFKTQATADSETVNAIDNAKIKTAIEATYSNQGTNLPSLTADQASVTVDGAIVSYTVDNNDNNGQKTYTITSITLNGIDATQDPVAIAAAKENVRLSQFALDIAKRGHETAANNLNQWTTKKTALDNAVINGERNQANVDNLKEIAELIKGPEQNRKVEGGILALTPGTILKEDEVQKIWPQLPKLGAGVSRQYQVVSFAPYMTKYLDESITSLMQIDRQKQGDFINEDQTPGSFITLQIVSTANKLSEKINIPLTGFKTPKEALQTPNIDSDIFKLLTTLRTNVDYLQAFLEKGLSMDNYENTLDGVVEIILEVLKIAKAPIDSYPPQILKNIFKSAFNAVREIVIGK